MRMKPFDVVLLLLGVMLTDSPVQAQDSTKAHGIIISITVSGFYMNDPAGEYENVLHLCQSSEIWDVSPNSPAFPALSHLYADLDKSGRLGKYGELFVEVSGHFTAYEYRAHTSGVFEITELERHSTAPVDPATCPWECEDIYGADSPTCLAQVDGQCGSSRNSCIAGGHFDDDVSLGTRDTATHYRWACLGEYGGDRSDVCAARKP